MPKLDQATIDNIQQNSDIVRVIGNYLPLVTKGKSIKCVCPFHDDHDPSLTISAEKQIYKCFVCGAAGNVFGFVQNFENLGFVEAVKRVAEISGIPVTFDVDPYREKIDETTRRHYDLLKSASEFLNYQLTLPANSEYRDYLYNRKLSDELIKKFQIGFQPKGDKLTAYLKEKGYSEDELLASSVIEQGNKGPYEIFVNRITFPLLNDRGHVVGFSARSLQNDQAKYINSTSTTVFQKSQLVYNYFQAKPVCQKERQVIVCEGVMDVIAFAKIGVNNAVATLGTACTVEQLKKIRQLSTNICVCYDGDEAGQAATYKLGKLANKNKIVIMIADNQTGLDPDEIIEKRSAEELIALTKKPLTWMEFLFKYLGKKYDIGNFSQREQFAKEILAEINLLEDGNHRQFFLRQLNELTKFNLELSRAEKAATEPKPIVLSNALRVQMEIINQMMKAKEGIETYRIDLSFLPNDDFFRLAAVILKADAEGLKVDSAMLYSRVSDENLRKLLDQIENCELLAAEYDAELLAEAIKTVKRAGIADQIKSLNKEIKETFDTDLKTKLEEKKLDLKAKELSYLPQKEE